MRRLLLIVAICLLTKPSYAGLQEINLNKFNSQLAGVVVDYTHNHHADHRIYSEILCGKRDLYVYLPPGYDRTKSYPLIVWLHGAFGDEHAFLDTAQIDHLDCLIRRGCFPPTIVICPDGTCRGENRITAKHSFYVNSCCCGRFADHVMKEVLPFVMTHYSILPEKSAHAIVGDSGGGFGAMNLALKHRDFFGSAATLAGVVNFCYGNVDGDYFADFSPETYRWRSEYDPNEVIGIFAHGLIKIKAKMYIPPVFGSDECTLTRIRNENPANLLFTTDLKPGELELFLAYGGEDNLNTDAQGESFVWLARQKGVECTVAYYPEESHSMEFIRVCQRRAYTWLAPRLSATPEGS